MTDEAINEVIARWMGWEFSDRHPTYKGRPQEWTLPYCRHHEYTSGIWRKIGRLHQYVYSLDDLQPVLAKLTMIQWSELSVQLDISSVYVESGGRVYSVLAHVLTLKPRQIAAAVAEVIQATQQTK